jgi:hypothetical protein
LPRAWNLDFLGFSEAFLKKAEVHIDDDLVLGFHLERVREVKLDLDLVVCDARNLLSKVKQFSAS